MSLKISVISEKNNIKALPDSLFFNSKSKFILIIGNKSNKSNMLIIR